MHQPSATTASTPGDTIIAGMKRLGAEKEDDLGRNHGHWEIAHGRPATASRGKIVSAWPIAVTFYVRSKDELGRGQEPLVEDPSF